MFPVKLVLNYKWIYGIIYQNKRDHNMGCTKCNERRKRANDKRKKSLPPLRTTTTQTTGATSTVTIFNKRK